MSKISPIPYRVPMVDRRTMMVDRNWAQWFEALLVRIGGVGDVSTNDELGTADSQEIGAQTIAELASLEAEIRGLQQLPVPGSVSPEELVALAPRSEAPGIELSMSPRDEGVGVDFILGEIT